MSSTVNMIPLRCHAALTDELKRGCRDTYNLNAYNHWRDIGMPLPGTHAMDSELLTVLVNFLTMNTLDYAQLVKRHNPVNHGFWGRLLKDDVSQEKKAHTEALMDLRCLLGEQDSLPWREDHVHFWQELDQLYQSFDNSDRQEMDQFFALLVGKTYSQLVSPIYIRVERSQKQPDFVEPGYVTSEFVSGLIRQDCALSLFAVAMGPEVHEIAPQDEQDIDGWEEFDCSSGSDTQSFEPDTPAYPPLNPFQVMNQGVRHETFQAALIQAFSCQVSKHHTKRVHIRFMGATLLIGTRGAKSFAIDCLEVPVALGFIPTKEDVLEAVKAAEVNAGFSTRMDDFLSTELGL